MKKVVSLMVVLVLLSVGMLTLSSTAEAAEMKMVGVIQKIDIAGKSAKTATAILKDNKTGESITIDIKDDLTLDKFKDHRIVEGDEIRCKYENVNGRNVSKLFRKTAGC